GQRKVHQILSEALRKAQTIVRGGQAKATETAAMVDRLTARPNKALLAPVTRSPYRATSAAHETPARRGGSPPSPGGMNRR
ncbi:DUF4226 domain-containing protein, partial [Nocardia abscessus]|uniref:DUF4226 domain-containing protein n=1 Tax=Nocardia abscessus TaxID=120957 RepID=UPI003CC7CA6E